MVGTFGRAQPLDQFGQFGPAGGGVVPPGAQPRDPPVVVVRPEGGLLRRERADAHRELGRTGVVEVGE